MATVVTSPAPAIIDQQGNINLQGRGGVTLFLRLVDADTGLAQPIAALSWVFEISAVAVLTAQPGEDATWKTVDIPAAIIRSLSLTQPTPWDLLDVTGDPTTIRDGVINLRGFTATPP